MSFADELREISANTAGKFAEEYAEKVRPILLSGAEEGYTGYTDSISNTNSDNTNLHLYVHPYFKEKLEELLEGVRVGVSSGGFYTKVHFNWGLDTISELRISE